MALVIPVPQSDTLTRLLNALDVPSLRDAVQSAPAQIRSARLNARAAWDKVAAVKRDLDAAREALTNHEAVFMIEIAAAVDANGKPKFGNEQARKAALADIKRQSEWYRKDADFARACEDAVARAEGEARAADDEVRFREDMMKVTLAQLYNSTACIEAAAAYRKGDVS